MISDFLSWKRVFVSQEKCIWTKMWANFRGTLIAILCPLFLGHEMPRFVGYDDQIACFIRVICICNIYYA